MEFTVENLTNFNIREQKDIEHILFGFAGITSQSMII